MVKLQSEAWTSERLAREPTDKLRALRENALKYDAAELLARCDQELLGRTQPSPRTRRTQSPRSGTSVVTEYHFVCKRDRGVTDLPEGRFLTGSWVVDETLVIQSLTHGAIVALHETKDSRSYRQGRIVDYALKPRDMLDRSVDAKIKMGIEFVAESMVEPCEWVGSGSGERGYRWKALSEVFASERRPAGEERS